MIIEFEVGKTYRNIKKPEHEVTIAWTGRIFNQRQYVAFTNGACKSYLLDDWEEVKENKIDPSTQS